MSTYPPNFMKLSVLIFSPQSFQFFLMKPTLLGKLLGAALYPPVQPLPRFVVGMRWFSCTYSNQSQSIGSVISGQMCLTLIMLVLFPCKNSITGVKAALCYYSSSYSGEPRCFNYGSRAKEETRSYRSNKFPWSAPVFWCLPDSWVYTLPLSLLGRGLASAFLRALLSPWCWQVTCRKVGRAGVASRPALLRELLI